ncbi:hypothetical protein U1Q18_019401 [Sarracenia purpurea var. burkii]
MHGEKEENKKEVQRGERSCNLKEETRRGGCGRNGRGGGMLGRHGEGSDEGGEAIGADGGIWVK